MRHPFLCLLFTLLPLCQALAQGNTIDLANPWEVGDVVLIEVLHTDEVQINGEQTALDTAWGYTARCQVTGYEKLGYRMRVTIEAVSMSSIAAQIPWRKARLSLHKGLVLECLVNPGLGSFEFTNMEAVSAFFMKALDGMPERYDREDRLPELRKVYNDPAWLQNYLFEALPLAFLPYGGSLTLNEPAERLCDTYVMKRDMRCLGQEQLTLTAQEGEVATLALHQAPDPEASLDLLYAEYVDLTEKYYDEDPISREAYSEQLPTFSLDGTYQIDGATGWPTHMHITGKEVDPEVARLSHTYASFTKVLDQE